MTAKASEDSATSTPEIDLHNDIAALRADFAALRDTVGKLGSEASKAEAAMGKTARRGAKAAASIGEEAWEETVQLSHDAAGTARDAALSGISSLERQIKANPINAMLIALGVGFFAGLIGHHR